MSNQDSKKTLSVAVASLVFGCLIIIPLLGLLFSIAAIVLGVIALKKINEDKENLKGQNLAIVGIVLGAVGVVILPVILLLTAIAVPNFLRARTLAQESAAAAALHTVAAAEIQYRVYNPTYAALSALGTANPPYIDPILTNGTKYSYDFRVITGGADYFYVTAVPNFRRRAHTFYIDEDGVLCRSKDFNVPPPTTHQEYGCPAGFSQLQ